ncbi:MAG: metal-dependent hydrolase [Desulfitobacterium hafniense]|nr:metal-dependent hydrolase [Desulfitobacterium hafniense]
MKIIFHGHACFEIQGNSGSVLIDPFLSGNPMAKVKPDDFKNLSGILVSHGHSDHLGDAVQISKNTGAPIIAVYELARYCERQGATVHSMHIGGKYKFPFGLVRLTQALHGSAAESSNGELVYTGLACGFLIQIDGLWLYHAGDTGLFGDMELIGRRHPIEVAMVPIGDNFVMGPEEAVYACQLLKPKQVIPMHYNTFPLIKQDVTEFINLLHRKALESKGRALNYEEAIEI